MATDQRNPLHFPIYNICVILEICQVLTVGEEWVEGALTNVLKCGQEDRN